MPLSVIFFGTHEFGAHMLTALINDARFDVCKVVTRPDKPVGRKKQLQAPPVKRVATQHGIAILQPQSLKDIPPSEFLCDLGITAQYGQLIPKNVLDAPKNGMLNVHTSLLPKYRGASPIQAALLHGDTRTGVTIMKMDEGLDTGPILKQAPVAIGPHDTAVAVERALTQAGAPLLLETAQAYVAGSITPTPQDHALASICGQLRREDGKIDWLQTSTHIYNQFRAYTPWPGVWTMWNGKRIKLVDIIPAQAHVSPGTVQVKNGTLYVGTGDAALRVLTVHIEGKQPMSADAFLRGYRNFDNAILE